MLFILTGDVQIGKTRWLEKLCADLSARGVAASGVIAPGQWVARASDEPSGRHGFDGAGRFKKLGIDNVLLPQGRRIEFARRRDLASAGDGFADGGQARAAQLGWAISDEAIDEVNKHFSRLAQQANRVQRMACLHDEGAQAEGVAAQAEGATAPGLLVVDELGRLELMRGCGLTSAMELLDRGPTRMFPHALVVVRETLLDAAVERFEPTWGSAVAIGPTEEARTQLFEAYGLA